MKGPSLQYDGRVLRVFQCAVCGRKVHLPGRVTSHLCHCGGTPRFMQPFDRPRTEIPDVSAFVTPVDPADLIEEEIVEEEPYVPFIPQLPPRPERYPNRRKLTDDIEKFQSTAADDTANSESDSNSSSAAPTDDAGRSRGPAGRRSPGSDGRGRHERRPDRDRNRRPDHSGSGTESTESRERSDNEGSAQASSTQRPNQEPRRRERPRRERPPREGQAERSANQRGPESSEIPIAGAGGEELDDFAAGLNDDGGPQDGGPDDVSETTSETGTGEPRRRSRRRGRRRGRGGPERGGPPASGGDA